MSFSAASFSLHGARWPAGRKPGRAIADDRDRDHVHRDGEDARDDAGDEQLADVLLGDQAVDREHRRGRDHDAERAAGRDHAGREALRIAEAAHLRIGDLGEGRGGRDRGAADRREAAAGRDRRDAEPAAQMAEERIGGAEQLAAHARGGGERAHQQEQRHHGEIEVGHRAHRGVADDLQRRQAGGEIAEAGDADEAHRHADRHAQQHQDEQADEPDDRDGVGAHGLLDRPRRVHRASSSARDGRSADRYAPRSAAPPRRRRSRRPRRTARPGCAGRRSARCRRAWSPPCRTACRSAPRRRTAAPAWRTRPWRAARAGRYWRRPDRP